VFILLSVALQPRSLCAQACVPADPCTTDGMCTNGMCVGTPQDGAPCNDVNDCTINDRCLPGHSGCRGDPAPAGSVCAGGCGTCLPTGTGPGVLTICIANAGSAGAACDPGVNPCLEGQCQVFAGNTAICLPRLKQCPDTDGDPCTDNCNFATGKCERDAAKCIPECEACDPSSGECKPANIGTACDDSNPCTPASRCEISTAGGMTHGLCLLGVPLVDTPTATPPPATPTESAPPHTATPTSAPRPCVGDCNGDHQVMVNELVIGVTIALGSAPTSQCPAFDVNADHMLLVNELIGGVKALLNGCG